LPPMLEAGFGRVVHIASTAALKGYPYVSAYVAAKHALLGLTRALAQEVATKGVTVNAVCPGFADTEIVAQSVARIVAKTGRSEAEARAELAKHNPQKRLVRPEEVAEAVLMLCMPGASAINGQAIAVDGGET
jgi:NAD(P)-dependent dehydrogenase (short-subunit alcohol dehydrogenase family)